MLREFLRGESLTDFKVNPNSLPSFSRVGIFERKVNGNLSFFE